MYVLEKVLQVLDIGLHDLHLDICKSLRGSNTQAIVNELGCWGYFVSSGLLNPSVVLSLDFDLG